MGEKLKGKKLNISSDKEVTNKKSAVKRGTISFEGSPRAGQKKQKKVNQSETKLKIKSRKLKSEKKESSSFEKNNFKVRKRKISPKEFKKNDVSEEILDKEEVIEDEKIENEETISIAVVLVILFVCSLVGILLGYLLYHIAINSSNALLIIQNLF